MCFWFRARKYKQETNNYQCSCNNTEKIEMTLKLDKPNFMSLICKNPFKNLLSVHVSFTFHFSNSLEFFMFLERLFHANQCCGVGVVRSRRLLGGVRFLTTLGDGVAFFCRLQLQMSNWIIFNITLLNWEFLLKWYNFFWNFCWNRDFLLCTTISIHFNSDISFPLF